MRKKKMAMLLVAVPLFAAIFIAGFGWAVHQLWNSLMPQIFGLPLISFWQAVGLLALSWLLFGGWRGMPAASAYGRARRRGWERLTPEQRERLARGMKDACRGDTAAGAGAGPADAVDSQ